MRNWDEILDALSLAATEIEKEIAFEQLAGNVTKEIFWQGQLTGLQIAREIITGL